MKKLPAILLALSGLIFFVILLTGLMLTAPEGTGSVAAERKGGDGEFSLLTTPENELLVKYIEEFCRGKKIDLNVAYMGDIDGINELNANSGQYDALWFSNSVWLYLLDSTVSVTDSKSTAIVPVVVGIKP
ncbi:MAG: hypothetical protein AAGU12_09815 [Clostridiales bacterium]